MILREVEIQSSVRAAEWLQQQRQSSFKSLFIGTSPIWTCLDVNEEWICVGTSDGGLFLFDRVEDKLQHRLLPKSRGSEIASVVKIQASVEHVVALGTRSGNIFIFQLPTVPASKQQMLSYMVTDVHTGQITCLEWSRNAMKLFSGDGVGCVVCTEIDYILRQSRTLIVCREPDNIIIQLSYAHRTLLVSTRCRSFLVSTNHSSGSFEDGCITINSVGQQERKISGNFGATFLPDSPLMSSQTPALVASRPGLRLWKCDLAGHVISTFQVPKNFLSNQPSKGVQLSSTFISVRSSTAMQFGPVFNFAENYVVTYSESRIFVIDVVAWDIVCYHCSIGHIVDIVVQGREIYMIVDSDESKRRVLVLGISENMEAVGSVTNSELALSQTGLSQTGLSQTGLSQTGLSKGLSSESLTSQSLVSVTLMSQPLMSPSLISQSLTSQHLLSQSLVSQPLSQTLMSQSLLSQSLMSQPLSQPLSQTLMSQPLLSQSLMSQPLLSQSLMPQSVMSQYLMSQSLMSQSSISRSLLSQPLMSQSPGSSTNPGGKSLTGRFVSALTKLGGTWVAVQDGTNASGVPVYDYNNAATGICANRNANVDTGQDELKICNMDVVNVLADEAEILTEEYSDVSVKPLNGYCLNSADNSDSNNLVKVTISDSSLVNIDCPTSGVTLGYCTVSNLSVLESNELNCIIPSNSLSDNKELTSNILDISSLAGIKPDSSVSNTSLSVGKEPDCTSWAFCDSENMNTNFSGLIFSRPKNLSRLDSETVVRRPSFGDVSDVFQNLSADDGCEDIVFSSKSKKVKKKNLQKKLRGFCVRSADGSPGRRSITNNVESIDLLRSQTGARRILDPPKSPPLVNSPPISSQHSSHVIARRPRPMPTITSPCEEFHSIYSPSSPKSPAKDLSSEEEEIEKRGKVESNETAVVNTVKTIDEMELGGATGANSEKTTKQSKQYVSQGSAGINSKNTVEKLDSAAGINSENELTCESRAGLDSSVIGQNVSGVDQWVEVAAPGGRGITSLSLTQRHAICTDKYGTVYQCALGGAYSEMKWSKVADRSASQLSVSPDGLIAWCLHKGSVFVVDKVKSRTLEGQEWKEIARDVACIAVDDHIAWYVKQNGTVMVQIGLSRRRSSYRSKLVPVDDKYGPVCLVSTGSGVTWIAVADGRMLYRTGVSKSAPEGEGWMESNRPYDRELSVVSLCVGTARACVCLIDAEGSLWFTTDVTVDSPQGSGIWWKVAPWWLDVSAIRPGSGGANAGIISVGRDGAMWLSSQDSISGWTTATPLHISWAAILGYRTVPGTPKVIVSSMRWNHISAAVNSRNQSLLWLHQSNGSIFVFISNIASSSLSSLHITSNHNSTQSCRAERSPLITARSLSASRSISGSRSSSTTSEWESTVSGAKGSLSASSPGSCPAENCFSMSVAMPDSSRPSFQKSTGSNQGTERSSDSDLGVNSLIGSSLGFARSNKDRERSSSSNPGAEMSAGSNLNTEGSTGSNLRADSLSVERVIEVLPPGDSIRCISAGGVGVWLVDGKGELYARRGVSVNYPQGFSWVKQDLRKLGTDIRLLWVSAGQRSLWTVDTSGRVYLCFGPAPASDCKSAYDWLSVPHIGEAVKQSSSSAGTQQVKQAGSSSSTQPAPQFLQVYVSPNDSSVWGSDVKGRLYMRDGITRSTPSGISWKPVNGPNSAAVTALHVTKSSLYVLTTHNECFMKEGNNVNDVKWRIIPGLFTAVTVDSNEDVWLLDTDRRLLRLLHHVLPASESLRSSLSRSLGSASTTEGDWEVL